MPQPEKQATIPELAGGARMLGIPTVLDFSSQKQDFNYLQRYTRRRSRRADRGSDPSASAPGSASG